MDTHTYNTHTRTRTHTHTHTHTWCWGRSTTRVYFKQKFDELWAQGHHLRTQYATIYVNARNGTDKGTSIGTGVGVGAGIGAGLGTVIGTTTGAGADYEASNTYCRSLLQPWIQNADNKQKAVDSGQVDSRCETARENCTVLLAVHFFNRGYHAWS
jgi:hypothetical protein